MRRYLFAALATLALAGCASQPSALDLVEGRINREADGFQIADVSLPPQGARANVIDTLTDAGLTVSNDGSKTELDAPSGDALHLHGGNGSGITISDLGATTIDGNLTLSGSISGAIVYPTGGWRPGIDNTYPLGAAANRWSILYLAGPVSDGVASRGVVGCVDVQTTAVGNVTTGEDDLFTYAVPAGLLASDGDTLRVRATFVLSGGSTLTLKSYLGSSTDTHASASGWTGEEFWIDLEIMRTGATSQLVRWKQVYSPGNVTQMDTVTWSETLANALTLKFTGESSAGTTDAIRQTSWTVEFVPAP